MFIANSSKHSSPSSQSDEVTNSSSVNLLKKNLYNRIGREQKKPNSSRYGDTSKITTAGLNTEEKIVLPRTELEFENKIRQTLKGQIEYYCSTFQLSTTKPNSGSLYVANNVHDSILLCLSTNNEIKNEITYL